MVQNNSKLHLNLWRKGEQCKFENNPDIEDGHGRITYKQIDSFQAIKLKERSNSYLGHVHAEKPSRHFPV